MKNRTRRTTLAFLFCAALLCQLLSANTAAGQFGPLVHQKNSLYHQIFVYQDGSVVTLQFGRRNAETVQSQVNTANPRQQMLEYTTLTFCGLLYKPQPQKMLLLGLGGGVIPREMRHYFPALQIDVAEIDPDVRLVASQFFGFQEDDKLKVHIGDGRMFVKKQLRLDPVPKYDLIILDAFNSDYIPFHLMTKEFIEEVKGVLADNGVVIANVFYSNRLFDAEFKTFLDVFGRCQTFFGVRSTNAMLVALGPAAPVLTIQQAADYAQALQDKHKFAFDLPTVAGQLRPDARPDTKATILTDDRAPVNRLRTQRRSSP